MLTLRMLTMQRPGVCLLYLYMLYFKLINPPFIEKLEKLAMIVYSPQKFNDCTSKLSQINLTFHSVNANHSFWHLLWSSQKATILAFSLEKALTAKQVAAL